MRTTNQVLIATGLVVLLTGCASAPVTVKTVEVPVIVPVPSELTRPEPVPAFTGRTNADLVDYASQLKAALAKANAKLKAISDIQPEGR